LLEPVAIVRAMGTEQADQTQVQPSGALSGVRVIELGGIGPAPFCTMVLADMGADVVRVVRAPDGQVPLFGRGKRSVVLDLKTERDMALLCELIDRADVLVEGFRPGVAERLGVGPEDVTRRNPGLVYARCTGWGQTGPMSSTAGHDINYIALAGVLSLIGRADQPPVPPLNLIGDFAGGGLVAAFGIVCALLDRARSGLGQTIDAAMVEGGALVAAMFYDMVARGMHDERRRGSNALDSGAPYYDVYETADRRWFAVGAVEPRFYSELVRGLGLAEDELPDRWDQTQWPALRGCFRDAFRTRTRDEWEAVFAETDACATPVLIPSECAAHPQHRAGATFIDVGGMALRAPAPRLSRTPGAVRSAGSAAPDDAEELVRQWDGGRAHA
jgi:alpha-methylacyl-CoA racemase